MSAKLESPQQQEKERSGWAPFVESVMAAPLGRSAANVLPSLDWPDIIQSFMITATNKLLDCSYVDDTLVDGVPDGLDADAAQFHFHPLHALVSYGRGLPVSHLSELLSPAAATAAAAADTSVDSSPDRAALGAASVFAHAAASAGSGAAVPALPWREAAARVKAARSQTLLVGNMKSAAQEPEASAPAPAAQAPAPAPAPAPAAQNAQQEGVNVTAAAEGLDCNVRDGYNRTGLHWAATAGQAEWISALIRAGGDPNAVDIRKVPPLQDAIEAKHAGAVRSLLEGGANKDVRLDGDIGGNGDGGGTPLVYAAMRGDLEIVRLLCAAGAGLEETDGVGFTALMTAVAHQHRDITEVLLQHGADADTESLRRMTPLMVSVALGDATLMKTLLRFGANACHAGIGDLTPLHIAAGKGSAHLIEDLLRAGADPSARVANPPPRSTPLHSACRSTRLEAVEVLLRHGADETLGDLTPPLNSPLTAGQAAAAAAAAAHAAPPGALAAALTALAAAGGGPGGRANGAAAAPARPATTPLGVVGIGNFGAGQDPTQRGPMESAAEFARRRDPQTMEAIRQALRNAPKARAWRRRSWLVMLRASAEAEASARATREKWELSSMTGSLVNMIGSGLVLGDNRGTLTAGGKSGQQGGSVGHGGAGGKGQGQDQDQEAAGGGAVVVSGSGDGDGGGGGNRVAYGSGSCAEDDDAKRVRRGGSSSSGGGSDGSGGGDEAEEDDSTTNNGVVATTDEAGSSPAAGGRDVESGGGGGGDDECVMELRFLCGRLFDLAAVEEGTFRRVLSYL
eukprot:g10707.t1